MKIDETNILGVIATGSLLILALLFGIGVLFGTRAFAAGIAAGGAVAILNGCWLYSILKRTLQLPEQQGVRFAQNRYYLRLGIIAVLVSLLVVYGGVSIFGLLLGLSVLVLAIIAVAAVLAAGTGR